MVNFFAWWIIRLSCAGLPIWLGLNTGRVFEAFGMAVFASGWFFYRALHHRNLAMISEDHEQAYRAYRILSLVTTIGAVIAVMPWLGSFETGLRVLGIWTLFVAFVVLFVFERCGEGIWSKLKLSIFAFMPIGRKAR